MLKYEDIVQQGCYFGFLEKAEGEHSYRLSQKGKKDFKRLLEIVDSNKKEFGEHAEKATNGLRHLCEMVYIERFANGLFKADSLPDDIAKKFMKELVRLESRSLISYDGIIGVVAYYLKPKEIKPVSCFEHKY